MKEILTLKEAARLLRVHPMTLYKLVRRQQVPATKLGGQWRFSHTLLLHVFTTSRG